MCSEGGGHRGWGTELPLLIILCHRFDFDGAKKVIHMLIFITKKIVGKVWIYTLCKNELQLCLLLAS